jgi:uncharacterized protein
MTTNPSLGAGAPIDLHRLLETRALFQANSGGGKSWALRRLLEQTAPLVQQLVIDPEGEFATLRERYDYIIAAPHDADAIATPQTAAVLARRLLESGVSAILDIYDLKAHERQLFVRRFLDALTNAPRPLWHPVLVVIDEAHSFCPQVGSSEASGAVIDLCTRGRKRGQCAVLATQRLSKLHKDAAAELLNVLVGRTGLDVDVKRAADVLGLTARDATEQLRNLAPGEFFAFGPALSPAVRRVTIGPVQTTHPKSGNRMMKAPPPPSAKVRAKLAELADLQREADEEARTVEDLQKQNADLRRKLSIAEKRSPEQGVPEAEVQRRIREALAATPTPDFSKAERLVGEARAARSELTRVAYELEQEIVALANPPNGYRLALGDAQAPISTPARPSPSRETVRAYKPAEGLTGPEQRILDAIAWMNSIGVDEPEQVAVAFIAGYTIGGGAWNNPRGSLRTKGLVEYRGDALVLTAEGAALARAPGGDVTADELHRRVFERLPGPESKLLRVLIDRYPEALSNDELAAAAGYSAGGGAFNNPRGRLRSLGLIEYRDRASRARDILFPGASR